MAGLAAPIIGMAGSLFGGIFGSSAAADPVANVAALLYFRQ
jgi:hypothetical protein